MISIGKYNTLFILRKTSVGLYLGDEETGEDVLLPNKYCPEEFELYAPLEVFVYRDNAERRIATTLTPDILLHEFALLQVADVSDAGVFMDWGLEKHLFVPFAEQWRPMERGQWHVIYMDIDPKTDRLYGSAKIDQRLQNQELTVKEGDEVDLLVYRQTDLGYSVIVNQKHLGLVFQNEVFRDIRIGEKLKGFVKKIREENKLDISLQPIGYRNTIDGNTDVIIDALKLHDGFLPITDKSEPDLIYSRFGMSKKAFKKAIGALYKERKIVLEEDGIRMT